MAQKKPGKVLFQGIESGMKVFRWMVLVLVILFLVSGLAKVQPTHIGILTRFGKLVPVGPGQEIREPGFVLAFPYPIDQLILLPNTQEQQHEVTNVWAALDDKEWNDEIDPTIEGYCLTAENDVIQVKVVVKYYISDPVEYEFNMIDPKDMIDAMTVASLTECIASWKFDEVQHMNREVPVTVTVLADGKEQTVTEMRKETLDEVVAKNLQSRLDRTGNPETGKSAIRISNVDFVDVHHLRHVKADFENKQTADIAVQVALDEALKQANSMRTEAETQAIQLRNNAEIYRQQVLANTRKEVLEYLPKLREFIDAPDYVWQREYLNTMENVWTNVGELKFVPANSRVVLQDEQEGEE